MPGDLRYCSLDMPQIAQKENYYNPPIIAVFPVTFISYARKRICPVAGRTRRANYTSHGRTIIIAQGAKCASVRYYFRITGKSPIQTKSRVMKIRLQSSLIVLNSLPSGKQNSRSQLGLELAEWCGTRKVEPGWAWPSPGFSLNTGGFEKFPSALLVPLWSLCLEARVEEVLRATGREINEI